MSDNSDDTSHIPSDSLPRTRDSLTIDFASNTELIDNPDMDHTRTSSDRVTITKMEDATADNALNKSGPTAKGKETEKCTTYAPNTSAAIPIARASRDFGGFAMDTQENTLYSQLLKDGDAKRFVLVSVVPRVSVANIVDFPAALN